MAGDLPPGVTRGPVETKPWGEGPSYTVMPYAQQKAAGHTPRGYCGTCGAYPQLRQDNTLRAHRRRSRQDKPTDSMCPGGEQRSSGLQADDA
ncbi:hypothetical protein ACFZAM_31625 [Streptomyces sp. NPDC008079]|uniref:hypothetical protein n=1 Tax=Streptomyces sp. NPDC008079 TaxID=3364806 RepID=UPI0036EDB8E9